MDFGWSVAWGEQEGGFHLGVSVKKDLRIAEITKIN